jgi:hypothetical protein
MTVVLVSRDEVCRELQLLCDKCPFLESYKSHMECPGREHAPPLTTTSKKLERVPRNSAAICCRISLLTSSGITHQAAPLRCSPTCTDVSNGDWPSVLGTVGIRAPVGKVLDFFFVHSIDSSVGMFDSWQGRRSLSLAKASGPALGLHRASYSTSGTS